MGELEDRQQVVCERYKAAYVAAASEVMSGFAPSTRGLLPVNGLRHAPVGGTTGWFLWCGESFSEASDFFSPLCTEHIYEEFLEVGELLGLAPGYRFLWAPRYVDVWFDGGLLGEEKTRG